MCVKAMVGIETMSSPAVRGTGICRPAGSPSRWTIAAAWATGVRAAYPRTAWSGTARVRAAYPGIGATWIGASGRRAIRRRAHLRWPVLNRAGRLGASFRPGRHRSWRRGAASSTSRSVLGKARRGNNPRQAKGYGQHTGHFSYGSKRCIHVDRFDDMEDKNYVRQLSSQPGLFFIFRFFAFTGNPQKNALPGKRNTPQNARGAQRRQEYRWAGYLSEEQDGLRDFLTPPKLRRETAYPAFGSGMSALPGIGVRGRPALWNAIPIERS